MKSRKIYILHGWTYSTEKWGPFLNELMKSGFEPVILNIPGLTAPIDRAWNINNYIEWLSDILKNEKEKVVILGHSNGGLISIGFTITHPDKVDKLILIDSSGLVHKEISIRLRRIFFGTAAKIGKKFSSSPLLKKALYKLARAHDYEKASPIMKKTMINLINTDFSEKLDKILIPVLIIWGKNDQVTPAKDGIFMNKKIKNSKLFFIDDASHSPQLTHFKKTADIIVNNL